MEAAAEGRPCLRLISTVVFPKILRRCVCSSDLSSANPAALLLLLLLLLLHLLLSVVLVVRVQRAEPLRAGVRETMDFGVICFGGQVHTHRKQNRTD